MDYFAQNSGEYFPTHRKGAQTRARILTILTEFPGATPEFIAERTGLGKRQIRRQLSNLRSVGQIPAVA
ncbi:MAG: helix-turn-helix transcriptional regulator [Cyanobacteria bacterium J06641_5]